MNDNAEKVGAGMVGFAVVGLGKGYDRAQEIQETEGADLKVVVDTDAARAEAVGGELGVDWCAELDRALERKDVDVVMVMTPSGSHADVGVRAAGAGKHVITTKPMDVTIEACDRLMAACEQAEVLCGVDYQCRYKDNNYRLAEAMKRGWLGKPILGEARFKWYRSQEYYDHGNGWRGTWQWDGGGSLANQGAHVIDLLCWWMGDPISVYGEFAVMGHDIESEDLGLAIVNYASGAKGTIMGTTASPVDLYYSAEIHGSEAAVVVDTAMQGEMRIYGDALKEKMVGIENRIHHIAEDVVSAVTQGTPLRAAGKEGRRTVALLEAVYASGREGRTVQMAARD